MDSGKASGGFPPVGDSDPTWSQGLATHPAQIREYRLLKQIGAGGMGAVYKAEHTKLKRIVALKLLPPHRGEDRFAIARFEREMEAIGRLDHPSVVRATDAGQWSGAHYLVMEYVQGIDLSALAQQAQQQGPLSVADACELVRQAALGLQYVHEHGLVHRDVKPSNLMLTQAGQVKILDLGLALLRGGDRSHQLTDAGQALGTADYMAPEQAIDSRHVDIRADIYSLGCTLYRLLAGRVPFAEPQYRGALEKILAHVNQPAPPLRSFRPGLPPELEAVIERMMTKNPAGRFATPREVAERLERFAAGSDLPGLARRAGTPERTEDQSGLPSTADPVAGPQTETRSSYSPEDLRVGGRGVGWWKGRGIAAVGAGVLLTLIVILVAHQIVIRIRTDQPVTIAGSRDGTTIEIPPSAGEPQPSERGDPPAKSVDRMERGSPDPGNDLPAAKSPAPVTEPATDESGAGRPSPAGLPAPPQITQESAVNAASMALPPARSPEVAHLRGHTGPIRCLAFSNDGKLLATGSDDQTVRVWDTETWQLGATLRGYSSAVNCLAFSADGSLLAWAGGLGYDPCVVVWERSSGRLRAALRWRETVTPMTVQCVVFSADGQWFATGGNGPVRIWNVAQESLRHELPWQAIYPSYVYSLAFAPDGATLAAGCHGGSADGQTAETVRIWNVATGQPGDVLIGSTGTFGLSHDDVRGVVLYSPDGARLVRVTSGDSESRGLARGGSIKIWSVREGLKPSSYRIPGGNVYAAHASRSGEILVAVATGASRFSQALGPGTFPEGFRVPKPSGGISPGPLPSFPFGQPEAASTDGGATVPAVMSEPTSVAVCGTAETRRGCLATGHEDAVLALALSPDGKRLATGSQDNTVKVWEITPLAWLK
jgi:serine/threonine protein kinase/WD40 repeat protein